MKTPNKFLISLFMVVGILMLLMGFNVDLKCAGATAYDNFAAGLPLFIFGLYSLLTALLLRLKPEVAGGFVAIATLLALILILVSVFDLNVPVIKTSCI